LIQSKSRDEVHNNKKERRKKMTTIEILEKAIAEIKARYSNEWGWYNDDFSDVGYENCVDVLLDLIEEEKRKG
jgi:hypothetical protein